MTCQHDPMFTTDGRCAKCYPRKSVVLVQHYTGAVEVNPNWFANQAVTAEQDEPLADEKMNSFRAYEHGLSAEDIAQMQAMCAETAAEAPTHDGMWK